MPKESETAWRPPGGRWSEGEAQRVVDQLTREGVSVGAFAKRHGLHPERVRYWHKRLRGRPRFVPVRVIAETPASPVVESGVTVTLWPDGSVQVSGLANEESARRWLRLLREAAC